MLSSIAEGLRGKRKVILVHGNADMDAMGSAYALAKAFPDADIYAPNSIDRVSKRVVEKLGIAYLDDCDLSSYEQVVVVDTSSPEQLEMVGKELPQSTIIIDHHRPTGKWDGYTFFCDDTSVSCCQIVKRLLDQEGVTISRDMGLMLLGGMVTDSGHFQYANPKLLEDFADIMRRCGIQMDEALDLTENDVSMSEKVAVLKAMERTKFDRVGNLIVATSYGSSFEASSCKALMSAGADVVFVGSQRDDSFRLSGRATQEAVRKGIDLGVIMKEIGRETVSDGGGHPGAAGISGIGDVEAMLFICTKRTMEVFREIKARGLCESTK